MMHEFLQDAPTLRVLGAAQDALNEFEFAQGHVLRSAVGSSARQRVPLPLQLRVGVHEVDQFHR